MPKYLPLLFKYALVASLVGIVVDGQHMLDGVLSTNTVSAKPNQPEKPVPHRGSGRRELMEYNRNARSIV